MKKIVFISFFSFLLAGFMTISCKKESVPETLQVLSLTDKVGNYGYTELYEVYSKNFVETPFDKGTVSDPDGSRASVALQPLADFMILDGNLGGKSTRSVTFPSNRYVFVPIISLTGTYFENDKCNPDDKPAAGQTVKDLMQHDISTFIGTNKYVMSAQLDGKDLVPDITKYHITAFNASVTPIKDFTDPNCDYTNQKASAFTDGYALLLKIPKGKHLLTYKGEIPFLNFAQDITWNLTVE